MDASGGGGADAGQASAVDVSVIIPAHNASSTIDAQLAALAGQKTSCRWEVLVVENGSNDDTGDRAESWRARVPGLRVLSSPVAGAARARNLGAGEARGRSLLFCDADDVAGCNWVEELAAALDGADAAAGPLELSSLNHADAIAWSREFPAGGVFEWPGFLPWAVTANLGVRAEVFRSVGGFDESFPYGEDVAFCWDLQLAGYTLAEAPAAAMSYRLRPTPASAIRQARIYAEAEVRLHRRFGANGMPRRSVWTAARSWLWYVTRALPASRSRATRVAWRRGMAKNLGRLTGSLRQRHLYP